MAQIESLENGELMANRLLYTINPNPSRFRFQKLPIIWEGGLNTCLGQIVLFVIVGLAGMFFSNQAMAWERSTHREITEKAIEVVASNLNSYLENNLGLEGGLDASVDGMTAKQWMAEGSDLEDGPFFLSTRPLNHFHEPITNSGLSIVGGTSSIEWSLEAIGAQDGEDSYSWNDAREYYFKALTSPTKTERDEYWGKTFRALGQVMHLLQDSANPSHVRADLHPFDDGLHDFMAQRSVGSFIYSGIFSPDPSMLEEAGPAGPNGEPFANLFDRETYHGSSPETTLGTDIGVTEYTNANFFSDDTIPGQGSIFSTEIQYPTVRELVPAPIPSPYLTLPRLGSAAFSGARAAKLTGNQAVAKFLLTNTDLDLLGQLELDDAVYEAQAQNLIPRAVGYSAAVLKYFFRGDLALQKHEYSVCSNPDGTFLPSGALDVDIGFPPNLFFEGRGAFYYDLPDGTRVFVGEGSVGPTDLLLGGISNILLNQLSFFTPVPWTIVFQGEMGPGAKEPRAVVALTGKAPWVDPGCPI